MRKVKFWEMGVSEATNDALKRMKYLEATEVQEKTIPFILQGEDVIVRSQTGTGKTAAFGVGLIEIISRDKSKKALILAPTRELAVQITEELHAIAKNHRLHIFAVYGGVSMDPQTDSLRRGFDVLVATPGRLLDHVRRGTASLAKVNCVVLDEADRMLDMGFKEDMDDIMSQVSARKQVMLFSATIDEKIMTISGSYMNTPEMIEAGPEGKVETIKEEFIELNRREKIRKLKEIIRKEHVTRMIVFVSTKRFTEFVCDKLNEDGIRARCLHGGRTQNQRERVLREFQEGKFGVLIATDVAARGIHVDEVSHIVNYDKAGSEEMHTHRIGRTGRMGKSGKAITFVELDPIEPRGYGGYRGSRNDYVDKRRIDSQSRISVEHAVYKPKD